jgi:3-oxo-5-alpha-steroid 4-dehydrogenase 1
MQWSLNWYGMGKTSVTSRLNLPGKIGWLTMEAPGFLLLIYLMFTLPEMNGIKSLPWENKTMATLFVSPQPLDPSPTS